MQPPARQVEMARLCRLIEPRQRAVSGSDDDREFHGSLARWFEGAVMRAGSVCPTDGDNESGHHNSESQLYTFVNRLVSPER